MRKMLEKNDWSKNQKRTKIGCMSFYHCPINYILEVVSIRRSRAIGEEVDRVAIEDKRRMETSRNGDFEGEVYQK